MDPNLILNNLMNAPVLFFLLGIMATWLRSELEIPSPIPRLLSLYLLFSIGYRGGVELAEGGLAPASVSMLLICMLMASLTPLWCFAFLRRRLDIPNAAAIAATYGSVSAVTFITAVNFLNQRGVSHGGHMVAAMALMESPAIIVAIALARLQSGKSASQHHSFNWRSVLHDALLNGAVLLLLGSLVIGALTHRDAASIKPFVEQPFKGVLCLFLLDMGLVAARRIGELKAAGWFLGLFAIIVPVMHGLVGIGLGRVIGAAPGDTLLLAVLCGSASYIAVPAAVRLSLPSANPGLFVPMSLAITFPFNVILGIPLYMAIIQKWWS